jgi:D-glycero-D-manno-heptose 1,7-bisphosphate phosphatase
MVSFHGRPFLDYLLELLREQGFERVLLLLGYRAEAVVDHFGDGRDFGLEISYDVTDPDDLTSKRVRSAAALLDETFLLLYCDNYWPLPFHDIWRSYLEGGAPVQVTVYANDDGYTRDNVQVDDDGSVVTFDPTRATPGLAGVEIGFALIARDHVLPLLRDDLSFEGAVYRALAERRALRAYRTSHRYYSVGDHRRLEATRIFLERRPAILLDRDGVLNARPPRAEYVTKPDEVRWLPGALEGLQVFAEAGWRVVVLSNQAGIGRGLVTTAEVDAVNERMRRDAEAAGGRIDAFYYCPHHWDDGCACRKPRPGLLFAAQRDHHLDLTRTTFIGDDERDAEAAVAAGALPLLLREGDSLLDVSRTLVREREGAAA